MNYVELHLGDWAQAVAHLSLTEEAVYLRLLRRYYAEEKPLPADLAACQRLAGARTQDEREAVAVVLGEFFVLAEDGYRNKRADEEIAKFMEGEPEREAKKANERERQRRARDERRRLFDELRAIGVVPAYDTHTSDLRLMLSRAVTRDVTSTNDVCNGDVTATQTPDTNHHSKDQERMSANADAPPADRLTEVTDQALDAYNAYATTHALPIARRVAMEKKRAWVKRSLRVIREVCAEAYGSPLIPLEFWPQFFDACGADPFLRGEAKSRDHPNWKPDFEYLTRPDVIAKVYERNAND